MKPVVILGAGLAGLACAKSLSEQGKTILVLEAKPKVGGRVSSFRTEKGFLVDEGFQVLLSSYPELKTTVSLDSLHLESFNSGALIFNGERLDLLANPFRHPQKVFRTLSFP
ncbi:MAG: FAD-dependent oxidoreductase, partial [Proteobacteria bacterium]|nr:FAD-dependent oxidoreductase [Pseudomonadota bacterium]